MSEMHFAFVNDLFSVHFYFHFKLFMFVFIKFQRNGDRRCRALYDCEADNDDELTFEEGDVIVVINEETEDENWMEGYLLSDPTRRGLFPVSFVHMLSD